MTRAKSAFIVIHAYVYHVPVRSKHKKTEIIFPSLKKKLFQTVQISFLLDPSGGEAEKYGNITKEALKFLFIIIIIIIIISCSLHAS